MWLGVQAAWGALRADAPQERTGDLDPGHRLLPGTTFRQGVLSNLGNPKMAVFFTSLLPQFTPAGDASFSLLALGLLFCAMTLVWLAGYAVVIAKAGQALARPRIRRVHGGVTGAVLVALGLHLALGRP